ncbi:MAG: IS200/IS605 family transposase [candidate division KSB1 bacterium]|nr:IS200/IS605 family transposase [candidate division KSB1 bacterium]
MPQSLSKVYIHLVFSTKNQKTLIDPDIELELYPYMAKVFRECDSPLLAINGHWNHIHNLFYLSRKHSMSEVVGMVKRSSSKWIKSKGRGYLGFYWQNGYGAFSIGRSHIDLVKNYISNQKIHHRKASYQAEYINLLKKYNIDYDERYVWD